MASFGEKLKELREKLGFTHGELASELRQRYFERNTFISHKEESYVKTLTWHPTYEIFKDLKNKNIPHKNEITAETLKELENGAFYLVFEILFALTNFFEVTADELLGLEDPFNDILHGTGKPSEELKKLFDEIQDFNTKDIIKIRKFVKKLKTPKLIDLTP